MVSGERVRQNLLGVGMCRETRLQTRARDEFLDDRSLSGPKNRHVEAGTKLFRPPFGEERCTDDHQGRRTETERVNDRRRAVSFECRASGPPFRYRTLRECVQRSGAGGRIRHLFVRIEQEEARAAPLAPI